MDNNKNLDSESIKQKYFHILCYYNQVNQKVAALNLWGNGIQIFGNAKCVKEFNTLKEKSGLLLKDPSQVAAVAQFVFESIIDFTRIIICFENFIKGSLLINGVIVHILGDKALKAKQSKEPIFSSEVFTPSSFINLTQKNRFEIINKTLSFSQITSNPYNEVVKIPKEIIEILSFFNELRNRLHFINNLQYSSDIISKIESLISFQEKIIYPAYIKLDNHIESLR